MNLFEGSGCAFLIGLILFGLLWGTLGLVIWVVLSFIGFCISGE